MELTRRLETLPAGRFHYKLLAATGLGWMFDAMDTGLIAFVLPALAKEWGLTATQMGMIGSVGLVGMALGAILGGMAAERLGRKTVFSVTLLLYSIATGLCGLAWSYESLLVLRFLVGFGLGAELPVAATLMTEYAPTAVRGRFMVLLESFWGLGWLAAALIAYLLIPHYGWKMAFFIGSLPALYVFVIRLAIPESVRYLAQRGRMEEAYDIVQSLEREAGRTVIPFAAASETEALSLERSDKASFRELWGSPFVKRTIMLWIVWFGIVYSYYGIFTWLPSLMVTQGYGMIRTFEYVLIMTLSQLPGYFSAAWLVDVIGRKKTLALYLTGTAVASYFFGQGGSPEVVVFWGSLISFFNLGAWGVVYTYTPELYPTRMRAFGSGWAAGVGRIGGMVAPIAVGYLIGGGDGFSQVFTMFTGTLLIVAVAVLWLGEETMHRELDAISK